MNAELLFVKKNYYNTLPFYTNKRNTNTFFIVKYSLSLDS